MEILFGAIIAFERMLRGVQRWSECTPDQKRVALAIVAMALLGWVAIGKPGLPRAQAARSHRAEGSAGYLR